jgi:hypothetical protein
MGRQCHCVGILCCCVFVSSVCVIPAECVYCVTVEGLRRLEREPRGEVSRHLVLFVDWCGTS